jgi:Flp pilus assembly protein TadG
VRQPGRSSQRGQVMVLFAIAMIALLAAASLAVSAGMLYWQRRQVQELADAAALAAAALIPCAGSQSPYAAANAVISPLAGGSPTSFPTTCASGTSSWTYADGTRVTMTYPYNGDSGQALVVVTRQVPLPMSALIAPGTTSSAVAARAVGRNGGGSSAFDYAIYAANGVTCGGTAAIDAYGPIYSGAQIGQCTMYAHNSRDGVYPGSLSVYPSGQSWSNGSGSCVTSTTPPHAVGNVICADSYEISGSQCSTTATDFLAGAGTCPSGVAPPGLGPFQPAEPNADANAQASITAVGGTAPCNPSGGPGYYQQLKIGSTVVGRLATQGSGNVPTKDVLGYYHLKPGCYGWLDVSLVRIADPLALPAVVLDPGLYYFSGFYQNGDKSGTRGPLSAGGLCLNGAQLLGYDVQLEFASAAGPNSLSTSTCDASPTSSSSALLGADPALPVLDNGKTYSYLSAPCTASANPLCPNPSGYTSWCPASDRACDALLVWTPSGPFATTLPQIDGTFFTKGASEWLYGSVFWAGQHQTNPGCVWAAGGTSTIIGDLACTTVALQGGSSSVGYSGVLLSKGNHATAGILPQLAE